MLIVMILAALCGQVEWKVSSLKAFAYDIGANLFRECHVKCLKSQSQTTDFITTAYRGLKLSNMGYALPAYMYRYSDLLMIP